MSCIVLKAKRAKKIVMRAFLTCYTFSGTFFTTSDDKYFIDKDERYFITND